MKPFRQTATSLPTRRTYLAIMPSTDGRHRRAEAWRKGRGPRRLGPPRISRVADPAAVLTWIRRRRSTRIPEMELCSMMWNEKAENEQSLRCRNRGRRERCFVRGTCRSRKGSEGRAAGTCLGGEARWQLEIHRRRLSHGSSRRAGHQARGAGFERGRYRTDRLRPIYRRRLSRRSRAYNAVLH